MAKAENSRLRRARINTMKFVDLKTFYQGNKLRDLKSWNQQNLPPKTFKNWELVRPSLRKQIMCGPSAPDKAKKNASLLLQFNTFVLHFFKKHFWQWMFLATKIAPTSNPSTPTPGHINGIQIKIIVTTFLEIFQISWKSNFPRYIIKLEKHSEIPTTWNSKNIRNPKIDNLLVQKQIQSKNIRLAFPTLSLKVLDDPNIIFRLSWKYRHFD